MKKYFFQLSLLILSFQNVLAQTYVTIPDEYFRAELKSLYPSCFNASDEMDITCTQIINEKGLLLDDKNISSLEGIQYFTNIEMLRCSSNNLKDIDAMPSKVQFLSCNNNLITRLPALPLTLQYLWCNNNKLEELPILPATLEYLDCKNNMLTTIPDFPENIKNVLCTSNNLTNLPFLPNKLDFLDCADNKLTSILNIPASLYYLSCYNNFLTVLPTFSSQLQILASGNCFTSEYINSVIENEKVKLTPNHTYCSIATSIKAVQSFAAQAKIYPNPATDKITVDVQGETILILYNSLGEILLQKYISSSEHIDIYDLVSGVYYYMLGNTSGKLIVR